MRLRKSLGQHLLVNRGVLKKIADSACSGDYGMILEIGPGTGNLTAELLRTGAHVTAVEIDENMIEQLNERFAGEPSFTLVRGDILEVPLAELVPEPMWPATVVGNLPYYISSPIIFRLLDHREIFSSITVMVQEEVGRRMTAQPGSRDFGMLSVFCQVEADCRMLFKVKRGSFKPPPEVDSAVVSIEPLPPGTGGIEDREVLARVVRGMFEHRRKTCYNSMRISLEKGECSGIINTGGDIGKTIETAFSDVGIDGNKRPEQLAVSDFISLANHFSRRRY